MATSLTLGKYNVTGGAATSNDLGGSFPGLPFHGSSRFGSIMKVYTRTPPQFPIPPKK